MSAERSTPSVRYSTIVADPPWYYEGFAGSIGRGGYFAGQEGQARVQVKPLPYPSMSVAEIEELPVAELAASDCWLFCWTTNRSPSVLTRWPSSVIAAPKPNDQHSRKPDVFLDLIEQSTEEPRIELFSRRARFGWSTWGNEALEGEELMVSGL